MNLKEIAGYKAAEFVREGMIVGLGTGSTANYAFQALGERVAAGLNIQAISTSVGTTRLAAECGIDILTFEEAKGNISGKSIGWLGDGNNNMSYSLIEAASKFNFTSIPYLFKT